MISLYLEDIKDFITIIISYWLSFWPSRFTHSCEEKPSRTTPHQSLRPFISDVADKDGGAMSGCYPTHHPSPISLGDFKVDVFGGGCSGSRCLPPDGLEIAGGLGLLQQPLLGFVSTTTTFTWQHWWFGSLISCSQIGSTADLLQRQIF